jgi:hypothetical protein
MNHSRTPGFICLFLLVSLAGVCLAEDAPSYVIYIQGSESSITNETDGITDIMVKDIIPYSHVSYGEKSRLIPVKRISNITGPLNAVIHFSGSDGESVTLVRVSNLSLYDENKVLTLRVHPLEFYEGRILTSLASEKNDLDKIPLDSFDSTGIYLEITEQTPQNDTIIELDDCSKGPC